MDDDPSSGVRDYHCGDRTYDRHDGTDFRLPSLDEQHAGVDVIAAAAGTVIGVRDGMADISIRETGAESVRGRECGNGVVLTHSGGWVTQYCHMARGSIRVTKGQSVDAGAPLGRVGLSGDTEFPHLHFAVRLGQTKIDPFAYGARDGECSGGASLWNASLRPELGYRQREIINTGFAAGPVTMEQVESGEARHHPPEPNSPALVAYVRAIGLEEGDVVEIAISAPDGSLFAQQRDDTLRFCQMLQDYQQRIGRQLMLTVQIRLDKARDPALLAAMRRAGVRHVAIGFESPIDEELQAMNKHIHSEDMLSLVRVFRRLGFWVHGMFIFGYPLAEPASFRMPVP